MTDAAGATEGQTPVIMPGLLGRAKLIFGLGDAVYVTEMHGAQRLVANTARQAAMSAVFQWLIGAKDRELQMLDDELFDVDFASESALFGPWRSIFSENALQAINLLAEWLSKNPRLQAQNAERERHQDDPEWLRQQHEEQVARDRAAMTEV